MYRFFIEENQINGDTLYVDGGNAHHILHVLRMREGEDIEAADENGYVHTCRINWIGKEDLRAQVLFSEKGDAELPNELTLYMGLPKFEKMEMIIQKAVELGVHDVVPVVTRRTVVKLDEKKAGTKLNRWNTIAEAAAKQSKRTVIPEVRKVMTFKEALAEAKDLDLVLIPYEKAEGMAATKAVLADIQPGQRIGIFIGPEGGFEENEVEAAIEAGAKSLTLGPRILRCETAALTILSILMFQLTQD